MNARDFIFVALISRTLNYLQMMRLNISLEIQLIRIEVVPLVNWSIEKSTVLSEEKSKTMVIATFKKHAELREIKVPINGSIIESVPHERILPFKSTLLSPRKCLSA